MRQPGRVGSCLKFGILLVLSWICVYTYIETQHVHVLDNFRDPKTSINIAQIPEKLHELVVQGFNGDDVEQVDRVFKDAQPTQQTFEVDEGITPEAYTFMKELGLKNPGENGDAVELPANLSENIQKRIKEGFDTQGYNAFVSSMIRLNRKLPDVRGDVCKNRTYSKNLPKCSVIIPFHNEDWMLLMRTVHSVLHNSPLDLINEILLVDDASTHEILQDHLDEYIKKYPLIKVHRSHRRLGIISNRMLGAVNSIGPVMVYLDSHVEVTPGWLEPILDRFTLNMNILVFPQISSIDAKTLKVWLNNKEPGAMGGFDWNMDFKWIDVKWYENGVGKKTPMWDPKPSPAIIGATHAMSKAFFKQLGMYDPDFDIWGGEDVELSFKYWLCGGKVEYVPCSFVAHMYKDHKYTWPKSDKGGYRWNTDRIAEVWLDDYIRYYYRMVGDTKSRKFGDISERIEIRKKNNCKPFGWLIDNIYPIIPISDEIKDTTAPPQNTTVELKNVINETQNKTA